MERYFEKITKCMRGIHVQVDDETYDAVEGLRVVYALVEGESRLITDGACSFQFDGETFGGDFGVKVCELNHQICLSLCRHFRYLKAPDTETDPDRHIWSLFREGHRSI